jgi:hypothetical protein
MCGAVYLMSANMDEGATEIGVFVVSIFAVSIAT